MARGNRGSAATEAPAETEATTTDETAAAAESTPEATPAAAEVDLTAFQTAVTAAVEARDTATGDVPVEQVAPVQAGYRELDGLKAKNAAKKVLSEAMVKAMNDLDITSARAYMVLTESLSSAGSSTKSEKAPADPTQAYAERQAALKLAYELTPLPEGVEQEAVNAKIQELTDSIDQDKVTEYRAWLDSEAEDKGDAPEVPAFVRAAFKLASGKAAGGRKAGVGTGSNGGVRRDIAAHIKSAFEDVESGAFLTVAEIRAHKSAEYGDEPPSAGAISARLFPSSGKSTVEGIEPGTNEKGTRGAKKL